MLWTWFLAVEDANRRIQYVPVAGLKQAADLSFDFALGSGPDPLALLAEKGVKVADGSSRLDWVRRFHSREDWLAATYQTEYGTAVCMLLDITERDYMERRLSPVACSDDIRTHCVRRGGVNVEGCNGLGGARPRLGNSTHVGRSSS